ncbi:primosomal protein N' [Treponema pectinovorum]|uniref:replication restart helicase PriA n=1 Tax=Treponema pectinovorum TaxID=164 RepID=UPI003D8A93E3
MARYLQVALNVPLPQTFTYLNNTDDNKNLLGCRVEIKFGARKTKGCVIEESDEFPKNCPVEEEKLRPITKVIDSKPILNTHLIELAKWISRYYVCSIGEAVSVLLPSAKKESEIGGFSFIDEISDKKTNKLSEEQKKAVEDILWSNSKTNLHYLYGPTGSGKTEVFLQCAQKILEQEKGVIYLVPEIALTGQVIEAVVKRFGQTAAVLHSNLTASQKLSEYMRIINRQARVVVGARSAVFAPVPDLGMIIIDEEHDGSYKSSSTPRYHARQVAMYRSAKLQIPLVMGSATPSVEAWYMMKQKVILHHSLTKRLAGGQMPHIKAVNLSNEPAESTCISVELEKEINLALEEKKQTILFLNRRGFTHFYRCHTCGFELKCKNCSVSLTYHKAENRLRCHYCGWSSQPPQQCPQCGSLDAGYSGFGTEFIEAQVRAKFPNAKIVRVDTDSLTKKGELQEKLTAFKKGEYDIMLGTQMVAKGLNFPNLKLVGVILADTSLYLPDFRAAERTFALITQVSGRAGRFFKDGKVLVQTYSPERQPILYSVENRIKDFYEEELKNRQMLNFPPFCRLVRLVFRAPTPFQAENAATGAAKIIKDELLRIYHSPLNENFTKKIKDEVAQTQILGPSECPIFKIAKNYRYQIILKGTNLGLIQKIASFLLYNYTKPSDVYIEIDVDPVSLL